MLSLSKAHAQQLSSHDSWHGDDALSIWSEDWSRRSRRLPTAPTMPVATRISCVIRALGCRPIPPIAAAMVVKMVVNR